MSELCALVSRIILETRPVRARRRAGGRLPCRCLCDRGPAVRERLHRHELPHRQGPQRGGEEADRRGDLQGVIARVLCRHARPAGERRDQRRDLSARAGGARPRQPARGRPALDRRHRVATARWRRRGSVPACSIIRPRALCGSPTGCISTACKSRPDRWCCRAPSSGRSNAGMAIGSSRISGPLVRSDRQSSLREFASCALLQRKRPGAKAARPRNEGHHLQRGTSPGAMGGKHRAMASIWGGCGIFSTN